VVAEQRAQHRASGTSLSKNVTPDWFMNPPNKISARPRAIVACRQSV